MSSHRLPTELTFKLTYDGDNESGVKIERFDIGFTEKERDLLKLLFGVLESFALYVYADGGRISDEDISNLRKKLCI